MSAKDGRCHARRYERTDERQACRSGDYKCKLVVSAGEVELNFSKLRGEQARAYAEKSGYGW